MMAKEFHNEIAVAMLAMFSLFEKLSQAQAELKLCHRCELGAAKFVNIINCLAC